jgi:hypothetical protein
MLHAVISAVALGVISTFGDYVWAALQLRHRMAYGLVHGAVICLCIGAAIGAREGRVVRGLAIGPIVGLLAAGVFYLLAPWLRYGAMFPAWMFFWICFAVLQSHLRGDGKLGMASVRGIAAALLSGAAFYAISGIWTRPSPGGPDYVRNLWSWTVAFLPGFLALFVGPPSAPGSDRRSDPDLTGCSDTGR